MSGPPTISPVAWPSEAGEAPPSSRPLDERLVAEISHDLRTPLASARLMVQALRDGLVDEEARESYLERVEQQIAFLGALVDELQSLTRMAEDPESRAECLHPGELIETAAAIMQVQAQARAVILETVVPPCLPLVRGDRIQLERVLLNLIENATRHARIGGRVVIRAEPVRGGVEIEVEDDGRGIAEGERERVFTPFYSLDQRGSARRSGLGLTIARAIVEACGGHIWVADSARGTRVRLSLPASSAQRVRLMAGQGRNS